MFSASPEAFESLKDDVESLWVGHIPVYESLPSPEDFYRHHVATNRPCVIRHQRTMSLAEMQSLCSSSNTKESSLPLLQVDVTPDGYGDCLRQVQMDNYARNDAHADARQRQSTAFFVKPMECHMQWKDFCQALQTPLGTNTEDFRNKVFLKINNESCSQDAPPPFDRAVFYYSRQNDCLRTELTPLWQQLDWTADTMTWASQVFAQSQPDAVNLWMGNDQAVSSMHKDPYENLYHVLHGTKVFTLVAPAYAPWLHERPVPSGRFCWDSSNDRWKVAPDVSSDDGTEETVPWITVDVTQSNHNNNIPYRKIRVEAGDMLYLPSLWFHQVAQEGAATIAVNYWYDMNFGSPTWAYFNFLQQMKLLDEDGQTHS